MNLAQLEDLINNPSTGLNAQLAGQLAIANNPSATTNNYNRAMIDIGHIRGRLIRALKKEEKLTTASTTPTLSQVQADLDRVVNAHKADIIARKKNIRQSDKSIYWKVPHEVANEIKGMANGINRVRYSQNTADKVGGVFDVAGNVVKTGVTLAKIPTHLTLKVGSAVTPALCQVAVAPLHLPAWALNMLLRPDSPYTGKAVHNLGEKVGEEANIFEILDEKVTGETKGKIK